MSFLKHLLNAIYEPLSSDFALFCENEMDILIKKKKPTAKRIQQVPASWILHSPTTCTPTAKFQH